MQNAGDERLKHFRYAGFLLRTTALNPGAKTCCNK